MRNSGVATVRAGQELLSADFLAQLERLSLLSRRSFRGRVKGTWLGLGMYVSRQAGDRLRSSFALRGPTVEFLGR